LTDTGSHIQLTLIKLGQAILASPDRDPQLLDKFDEYVEQLEEWLKSNRQLSSGSLAQSDLALMKELENNHNAVLEKAERLKEVLSSGMKKLKRRGKSILAYGDIFPRQMGMMRAKKW
jgi:hypothetical protein